jgi:hypothetical protein
MTPELAAAIGQEAARESISVRAWIANAAQHRVLIQRGVRAMDEYQREYGAFTAEERAEARTWLDRIQRAGGLS